MSWVPLPWCASQSTTSTRSPRSRSAAAATATLLSRQKPIARAGDRVVTGRPDRAERGGRRRRASSASTAARPAPGGEERGVPRSPPTPRCRRRASRHPAAQNALELVEVLRRVCTRSSSARVARRAVEARAPASSSAAAAEPGEHGPQPGRPLGVPAAGIVLGEARIGRDQEHAARVTSRPLDAAPSVATLAAGEGASKAQSYRFRGGVARVAAWHGRADVASLAVHGPDAPLEPARCRAPARSSAAGRLPGSRHQRARARGEPPARRRRLRGARPAAPPRPRLREPARDVGGGPAAPAAATATRCSPPTRPRSTTSGTSTATGSARPRARRRARTCG